MAKELQAEVGDDVLFLDGLLAPPLPATILRVLNHRFVDVLLTPQGGIVRVKKNVQVYRPEDDDAVPFVPFVTVAE